MPYRRRRSSPRAQRRRISPARRSSPQALRRRNARSSMGVSKSLVSKKCGSGKIYRKGYTRKAYVRADGTRVKATHVKGECITRQGSSAPRKRVPRKRVVRKSPKAQSQRRSASVQRCGSGKILRSAYRRHAYVKKNGDRVKSTFVSATCIRDLWKKGKGKARIQGKYKLRKGALTALGYSIKDKPEVRRAALEKAIKEKKVGVNSLKWKINAQAVFRKNASPSSVRGKQFKVFENDLKWLKSKFPAKGKARKSSKPAFK